MYVASFHHLTLTFSQDPTRHCSSTTATMSRVDNQMFGQPLEADFTHPSPYVASAYRICYLAEHAINPTQNRWPTPRDETVKTKLINIRILGHLLSQSGFLSDTAISEVARSIMSCQKDPAGTDETDAEALDKLGEFYRDFLLRPFKHNSRTPDISSPSSSESSPSSSTESFPEGLVSFDLTKEEVDKMLAEQPKSYFTSRKLADHREDHRCVATRILDVSFAAGLRNLTGEVYEDDVVSLAFCHILPELTNMGIEGKENEHDDGRNVWNVLKSLGYTDIANHFGTPDNVHSLDNVMMMSPELRSNFDRLYLWFEPIEDVPNRYRLCSVWTPPHGLVRGQEITFQSTDPRFALPNREYLRIHAACCRVGHLSGASLQLSVLLNREAEEGY
ncbi:hypothetical protein LXA43DRAFT_1035354 [Ganoderma leucocontextum]|nr:hypothetical protein LXA43DRAFT_1035354 [Ganoderma leucocontextum]